MDTRALQSILRLLLRQPWLRTKPVLVVLVTGVLILVNLPWRTWFLPKEDCLVQKISDGDTVQALCDGEKVRIRFYCIDAPELSQDPWGRESRAYLASILPETFRLETRDRDRYGRVVGELRNRDTGESINRQMVQAGQAAVYPRYCSEARFFQAEAQAKEAGLGIWREAGDHQTPWAYRRTQRRR